MRQPLEGKLQQTSTETLRAADHPIDAVFVNRWSPRAYDASAMTQADLMTIVEAARWAPSAYNIQPWRFVYAHRDDARWLKFLDLLDPINAAWAQQASALLFVLSDKVMPGDDGRDPAPSSTHSFDAGAAWAQLALQATLLGYQAHAMAGVDFEQARAALSVPARYRIEVAVALGRPADPSILPAALQAREQPSPRRPLQEIAFAGAFRS